MYEREGFERTQMINHIIELIQIKIPSLNCAFQFLFLFCMFNYSMVQGSLRIGNSVYYMASRFRHGNKKTRHTFQDQTQGLLNRF